MADEEHVLAIDSASPLPAVALRSRGRVFEERLPEDRRASEELLPAVGRCLERAGIGIADVRRLALCAGPGSFTGLRVGLATGWGLARASGAAVETVSTLEAMAEAARAPGVGRVWTALDAGRGDAVFQPFDLSGERARALEPARRGPAAEAARAAAGAPLAALPPEVGGDAVFRLPLSPAHALALAASRFPRPGSSGSFEPEPIYGRASAAEEKRGAA